MIGVSNMTATHQRFAEAARSRGVQKTARDLECTASYVYSLMRGKQVPSLRFRKRIADVLRIPARAWSAEDSQTGGAA